MKSSLQAFTAAAFGLFAATAMADTKAVQDALDALYPGQGWVARDVGDATSGVPSGLVDGSIRTHPSGNKESNSPAVLSRKLSIASANAQLHLKVRSKGSTASGGDWVLRVFVNGSQLDSDVRVCTTTAEDYYYSLAEFAGKGEVTLELQNCAGGGNDWCWECAYWDLIEVIGEVDANTAVQRALEKLYPGQGWTASGVGDATAQNPSGLVDGSSVRTHPVDKDTPAVLSRKLSITSASAQLHLKVRSQGDNAKDGDWVLRVFANGSQLGTDATVCSTAAKDYYYSLAEFAGKGEVTLELRNCPGGGRPWSWECAYWDVIEIMEVSYALTEDEDWSNREEPIPDLVDLNGHRLTLTRFDGVRSIVDTSAAGSGGELYVNCATDISSTDKMTFSGSFTFVKDGTGTLTWAGGTSAATVPILITNGVFKLDVKTPNVFGNSGTITVKEKGQFNLNYNSAGNSPVLNKKFEIEGDGPDGSGALINYIYKAPGGAGEYFSEVTLTGDATIGGNVVANFRGNGCGVYGPDYVLTSKNTRYIAFCAGDVHLNVRRVVCTDGGAFQPCADATDPFDQIPEGVFLRNGGILRPWSNKNDYELPFALTVEAGETGSILCDYLGCKITGAVNVGANATLSIASSSASFAFSDVVNDGTITAVGPATITGTLSGGGAITGASIAFAGESSCWHVDIDGKSVRKADLENAPANFLSDLKKIAVSCVAACGYYDLAPSNGLTDEKLGQIALEVTDKNTGRRFKKGQLQIRDGRLGVYLPTALSVIIR